MWVTLKTADLSFLRRQESTIFSIFWIPAFAGMTLFIVTLTLLLTVLFLRPSIVLANATESERLTNLEQKVASIEAILDTNNKNVADALATLQEIRGDFQELKGSLEEVRFYSNETKKNNQTVFDDMDRRLSQLEDKVSLFSGQMDEVLAQGKEAGAPKDRFAAYKQGLLDINNQDYKKAVADFGEFLKRKDKGDLAGNAQYWIGEAYFAMKDYANAVAEFQKVVEKYPRSPKVAGALLKQGYCFHEMKMIPEAEAFLQKVITDYAKTPEAQRAQDRLKLIRQGVQTVPQGVGAQ